MSYRGAFYLAVWVFLFTLIFSVSAKADDNLVTEPEKCLLLGSPYSMQYVSEANLFLMVNGTGVRAYDVETGAPRWHFIGRCSVGKKYVLAHSAHGIFLLDRTTGKEVWSRRDNQRMQPIWATMTTDEAQVVARYERETVLYDVEGKCQRTVEVAEGSPTPVGILPGGKTLLFHRYQPAYPGQAAINRVHLVDRGSGRLLRSFDLKGGETWRYWIVCSPSGQLAAFDTSKAGVTTVKIWDADKETLVRDLGPIPETSRYGKWTDDEKHLIVTAENGSRVYLLDTVTGEIQTALAREGHVFRTYLSFFNTTEGVQLFSRDRDGAYWLWSLTPGSEPKKMFDGHGVAFGGLELMTINGVHVKSTDYGSSSTAKAITLFTLEDLNHVGEWRISNDFAKANKDGWSNGGFFNQMLTHYVDIAAARQESNTGPPEYGFGVFGKDADKAVLQGYGRPLCLSPDGRYMVVQRDKKSAMLIDLTGKETPSEFTGTEDRYYNYMSAAFSEDGKWLAVIVPPEMELVSMTEGFPRKRLPRKGSIGTPIRFSPDGTRVLCGGYEQAFLYDTDTGTLLHTFVETERFLPMYEYTGSVWNNILTSAKEWAGLVTDTFKSTNGLECAFGGNGTRVVTHISGQLIRIWDSNTGERLQTIYTKLPEKRDSNGQIRNSITLSESGDYAFSMNQDGFAPAMLWSLQDGILLRRYQLPVGPNQWSQAAVSDDGALYIISNGDLNRWPGRSTDVLR